jgi:hypothetical protein
LASSLSIRRSSCSLFWEPRMSLMKFCKWGEGGGQDAATQFTPTIGAPCLGQ